MEFRIFQIILCSVSLVISEYNYFYDYNFNGIPNSYQLTNGYNTNQYSNGQYYPANNNNNYAPSTNFNNPSVPLTTTSTCDNYFSYRNENNQAVGHISISNPDYQRSIINVTLSLAARLLTRYVGDIGLIKDKESAVNDISNGLPILYRVRFPLQNPLPKLTAIYYNDQLLCTGPKEQGQYVTTITLDHTLYTGLAYANRPNTVQFYNTQRPEIIQVPSYIAPQTQAHTQPTRRPQPQPTQTPTRPQPPISSSNDRFNTNDFECGVPDYAAPEATGLVINGLDAKRGEFPWLAAYFHNGLGENGFICGGSLISTKIVLTAAHCIHNKRDPIVRKAEEATFFLGKYNLQTLDSSERGFISSAASSFIIHPDWNSDDDRYDADIAAVVLTRIIQFTKYIKPICLWTTTVKFTDLINKSGVVVGWGKTEFNAVSTDRPKFVRIKVVDEGECLRSNGAFQKIASERTFCAGAKDGQGPCSGDSGGGFIIENGNKWYLRGIVSSALFDKEKLTCDVNNYAVFTDVTRYTSWVEGFIQQYG